MGRGHLSTPEIAVFGVLVNIGEYLYIKNDMAH